jgi:hypothetical protein
VRNVPFNGDPKRLAIVDEMLDAIPCDAGIETGTWVGNTTQWLLKKLPRVHAIELDPGLVGICTLRFASVSTLVLHEGSSSELLGPLLRGEKFVRPFVYLDAHDRGVVPPLDRELEAVAAHEDCVVLIDDFKVPETDFGFGTYGPIALDLAYVRKAIGDTIRIYGPSYPCERNARGWALFGVGRAEPLVAEFAEKSKLALLG